MCCSQGCIVIRFIVVYSLPRSSVCVTGSPWKAYLVPVLWTNTLRIQILLRTVCTINRGLSEARFILRRFRTSPNLAPRAYAKEVPQCESRLEATSHVMGLTNIYLRILLGLTFSTSNQAFTRASFSE